MHFCNVDQLIINFFICIIMKFMDCISQVIDATIGSVKGKMHPLAILASELRQIAEKDLSIFSPVLGRWYPECAMVTAKMLHQLYGERLVWLC